jgi:hypothetical protein
MEGLSTGWTGSSMQVLLCPMEMHPGCYRFLALDLQAFFFLFRYELQFPCWNFKNIMFKDERIAYEVSMNDISLIYT